MPISRKKGPRSKTELATDALGAKIAESKKLEKVMFLVQKVGRPQAPPEEKYEITESKSQRQIILEEIGQTAEDLVHARRWEYKKWIHFLCCFVCNLIGVTLALASFGQTVLFAQFPKNTYMLVGACLCFIPTFVWIKVVFFAHGEQRIHLDEMTERRAVRRFEAKQRYLHLQGRLPRPPKEVEDPEIPFEYDPEEPWMYKRWQEKPKVRVWYDSEGIAHRIKPGSAEEAAVIKEEEEMQEILSGVLAGEKHAPRQGSTLADEEALLGLDEEGRMSSAMEERRSSVE